jgi:hypothetical protein
MKKIIIAILLVFMAPVWAGQLLSPMEFTQLYAKKARQLDNSHRYAIVKPLEVSVGERRSFLDNAYIEYQNNPQDLNDIMDRYLASFKGLLEVENRNYTKDQIFPVMKDYLYLKNVEKYIKKGKGGPGKALVYEKLNDVLYVLYAFDSETSIRFLSMDDVKKLGLKKSELRALAKKNLNKAIPDLKLRGDPSTLSLLVADGNYEASFLLFDKLWTKKQFPVKGDIVVYVPTRDLVLITGSKDKQGLQKARDIVYDPKNKWSHIVAEVGFVRKGNRWRVFKP